MTQPTMTLDLDNAFGLLANQHRRSLLLEMHQSNDDRPLTDVINTPEMHHIHFPKLEDYGLIERDTTGRMIRRGEQFGDIEPLLDLLLETDNDHPNGWT